MQGFKPVHQLCTYAILEAEAEAFKTAIKQGSSPSNDNGCSFTAIPEKLVEMLEDHVHWMHMNRRREETVTVTTVQICMK